MHIHRFGDLISSLRSTSSRLWLMSLILCSSYSQAEPRQVAIPTPANMTATDNRHYYQQLLLLALEKTRTTYGDFRITHHNTEAGPERERAMLIANAGLDVLWGSLTQERQNTMQVIPIDLVKSLNRYRLLIIRNNAQPQLDKIDSLAAFRTLRAGSGINWSHNVILKKHGIQVTTSGSFSGIYKMLASDRFDYVLRAPYEIAPELAAFSGYGVRLEAGLLIQLADAQDYCFFVRKDNTALANRIEQGLKLAQADGSFDALFNAYPNMKNGMELLQQPHRLTIELKDLKNQTTTHSAASKH